MRAYQYQPRFKQFAKKYNLDFKPYMTYGKHEIEERGKLLVELVKLIWNDEMFR